MQPKSFTVTATAGGNTYSPVVVVDTYNDPCNIALGIVVTGSALYTVQHNFTDPRTTNLNTVLSAGWMDHQFLVNQTTTSAGNYAFPPAAIRLSLGAAATATAVFTVIQGGPNG